MKNEFTGTKWEVDGLITVNAILEDGTKATIVACPGGSRYCMRREMEANARLIAAAPEMLAALEMIQNAFIHVPGDKKGNKARSDIFKYGQGPGGMAEAATAMRRAIYKAKGN